MDLSGWDLRNLNLEKSSIGGSDLSGADLFGANLSRSYLQTVNFENANLTNVDFRNSYLGGLNLENANLTGSRINGAFLAVEDMNQDQLYSTASYAAKDLRAIVFGGMNLAGWDLSGQDLRHSSFPSTDLTNTDLSGATINFATIFNEITAEQFYSTASYQSNDLRGVQALFDASNWDLTNQDLTGATVPDGADVSDAIVKFARFPDDRDRLYSTASYRSKELRGISFGRDGRFEGWDFSGQNLTGASFKGSINNPVGKFAEADFSDANIRGADFSYAVRGGFSAEQLYSTASYQDKDLRAIQLNGNDLSGWNFNGQDLSHASLSPNSIPLPFSRSSPVSLVGADLAGSNLTNASLRGADLTGARFSEATVTGADLSVRFIEDPERTKGLTQAQLYSTRSHQIRNLRGIQLEANDLSGWDLSGQDMSNANLRRADLTKVNLDGANLFGADLRHAEGFAPGETTIVENAILPDATMRGLNLLNGERLLLSRTPDFDDVIVRDELTVGEGAVLEFDTVWAPIGGELSADRLIVETNSVSLGGTLRLTTRFAFPVEPGFPTEASLFSWQEPLAPDNVFSSVELPPGRWDLSDLYTTGVVRQIAEYRDDGDFNVDGELDVLDIDRLSTAIQGGRDLLYDLNRDRLLDRDDLVLWVHEMSYWFSSSRRPLHADEDG